MRTAIALGTRAVTVLVWTALVVVRALWSFTRRCGRPIVYEWRWWRSPRRQLLMQLPQHAVCAKIGVWTGEFSDRILQYTKPRELHLIDPWRFDPRTLPMRGQGLARNQADMDAVRQRVLKRFRNRAAVHCDTSAVVLPAFPDGYFDWVYIDGDHSEAAVRADLELALRKVKDGGVIAGDDFTWERGGDGRSVQRAVLSFVEGRGLRLRVFRDSQYWIERGRCRS